MSIRSSLTFVSACDVVSAGKLDSSFNSQDVAIYYFSLIAQNEIRA